MFQHALALALQSNRIKYLDIWPQAQLPPPYAEDISALLTLVFSYMETLEFKICCVCEQ